MFCSGIFWGKWPSKDASWSCKTQAAAPAHGLHGDMGSNVQVILSTLCPGLWGCIHIMVEQARYWLHREEIGYSEPHLWNLHLLGHPAFGEGTNITLLWVRIDVSQVLISLKDFVFLKMLYLFMRETERGRDTGRGRSKAPCRKRGKTSRLSSYVGPDPRSPGLHPGLKAALNRWATGLPLIQYLNFIFTGLSGNSLLFKY